ncbi:hypothetical protein O181_018902 [Austropuccinia psidii MF-1]|uniref:Peptidase A2 domain-containing protein n=1 Tax=Austropuccinia psidii MF-1 TaxID=1389203 RepID=A0A9Q3GTX5_9BASI|nr:hypothetical protein [Austropuccinia psidii MF-1]
MDLQERLLLFGFKEKPKPKIHYACPLGFMEIFIGKEEYPIRELVDTGGELNIIPEEIAIKSSLTTRKLNMNLRGIGGHTTSLVALSEFTPVILASGEILGYQEPYGRRLSMPISKPQALGWQTGPPRGMDLCNMAKLVRNTPGKKEKIGQDLQNHKWPNNFKRQIEESISEDKLPKIIYKPINEAEENFQILVDGKGKINGNPFKTKSKKKKVRFSEHNELSDEEIINEIEKDFKIIEERDKNLKETYHIDFLDRTLNNQEEPY